MCFEYFLKCIADCSWRYLFGPDRELLPTDDTYFGPDHFPQPIKR